MKTIEVRNVNEALPTGLHYLTQCGERRPSRNGAVLVAPGPVLTKYNAPWERVLWSDLRDANPVFHLMECIWMCAGEEDSAFLLPYNPRMGEYAENSGLLWGAYGYRWRHEFEFDQIATAIAALRADPTTRRVCVAMWDASADSDYAPGANAPKDLPCNTHIYFQVTHKGLEMTVCCRSNDIIWGAYGANVVHFSFLQQVMSECLEVPQGPYYQFSNNYHMYTDMPRADRIRGIALLSEPVDLYRLHGERHGSVMAHSWRGLVNNNWQEFSLECLRFTECALIGTDFNTEVKNAFLARVAWPLHLAYTARKRGELDWWQHITDCPAGNDWILAFRRWAERRQHASGGG